MVLIINTTDDFEQIKLKVISTINDSMNNFDIFLPNNSINNLSIHLTIATIRLMSNNYIPLSNSQIANLKDDKYYPYAKELCLKLSKLFNVDFPENEISLVTLYLSKNQLLDVQINSGFDLLDSDIFNILRETMFTIDKQYNQNFRTNNDLFISLGLHLTPAVERLLANQLLDNPLTTQIKQENDRAFEYCKVLNNVIENKYQKSFNDDELAYIALHFSTAQNNVA